MKLNKVWKYLARGCKFYLTVNPILIKNFIYEILYFDRSSFKISISSKIIAEI